MAVYSLFGWKSGSILMTLALIRIHHFQVLSNMKKKNYTRFGHTYVELKSLSVKTEDRVSLLSFSIVMLKRNKTIHFVSINCILMALNPSNKSRVPLAYRSISSRFVFPPFFSLSSQTWIRLNYGLRFAKFKCSKNILRWVCCRRFFCVLNFIVSNSKLSNYYIILQTP